VMTMMEKMMKMHYDRDGTHDEFVSGSGMTMSPLDVTVDFTPNTILGDSINVRVRADTIAFVEADITGSRLNGEVEDWSIPINICDVMITATDIDGCAGSELTATVDTMGGMWSVGSSAVSSVDQNGLITLGANATGANIMDSIFYSLPTPSTCADTIVVTIFPAPTCTVPSTANVCSGATLMITESGSDATMWTWSSDGSAVITNGATATMSATGATDGEIFTVLITDANGCTSTCMTTVTVDAPPSIVIHLYHMNTHLMEVLYGVQMQQWLI